jgi:Tol biopolymer transport system component
VAFAPDGKSMFFAKAGDGPSELFRMSISGESTPVGLGVFVTSFPDITVHPDGRRVAFLDNEWLVDFWQMSDLADAFAAAVRPQTAAQGR